MAPLDDPVVFLKQNHPLLTKLDVNQPRESLRGYSLASIWVTQPKVYSMMIQQDVDDRCCISLI